jgi:hypothetical protein
MLDAGLGLLFEAHIILRYSYVFLYIYADHFASPDDKEKE